MGHPYQVFACQFVAAIKKRRCVTVQQLCEELNCTRQRAHDWIHPMHEAGLIRPAGFAPPKRLTGHGANKRAIVWEWIA